MDHPDLHGALERAWALHRSGEIAAAESLYRAIIAIDPECFEALNRLGSILVLSGLHEEACEILQRAAAIRSDHPATHANHGNALMALGATEQALASFDRALQLKSDFVPVLFNRGNALKALGRLDDAVTAFAAASAQAPDHAGARYNRGNTLLQLRRNDEAVRELDTAFALNPAQPWLAGTRLHAHMRVCDWHEWEALVGEIATGIRNGKPMATPFVGATLPISLADQRMCAEIFVEQQFDSPCLPDATADAHWPRRLRIGYFSSAFRNHPTTYLIAGMLERQNRDHFRVIGCSLGRDQRDAQYERIRAACDEFGDCGQRSDNAVVVWARAQQLDIAIDLDGHTVGSRLGVFSHRLAALQVTYLGFPATTGARALDYLLTDPVVTPPAHDEHFTESLVRLPGCYQVNDYLNEVVAEPPPRAALGLPAGAFVFCCFNNTYKITPDLFAVWMRLLRDIRSSVLWLLADSDRAMANLRREASEHGIDGQRLVFAERTGHAEHLARQRRADLFLDTLYYNAHTTGSDALWMGLPVLTCMGETFAARVGASLLQNVGLPEMITASLEEYTDRALELARDTEQLAMIRWRLEQQRETCALFDTGRTTRNIERAFELMWSRHQQGLPPVAIDVAETGLVS